MAWAELLESADHDALFADLCYSGHTATIRASSNRYVGRNTVCEQTYAAYEESDPRLLNRPCLT